MPSWFPNVVQHANVRVIQAGDRFRFALNRCLRIGFSERCDGRILMATLALKARVARAVKLRHAACAERRKGSRKGRGECRGSRPLRLDYTSRNTSPSTT